MLGGAVGMPTSAAAAASAAAVAVAAHKQFHPNSPPLDIDSWKEAFLLHANNSVTTNGNINKNDADAPNNEPTTGEDGVSSTAINLSSRPSSVSETATNQGSGNAANNLTTSMEPDSQDDQQHAKNEDNNSPATPRLGSQVPREVGGGKLSPLQALFSPPGLQQMQQFLQHMANNNNNNNNGGGHPGFNPAQLQHFMQQQQSFLSHHQQQLADAGRKQLEQLMQQLQEQLQINLLQQTHLMQTNSAMESNKNGNKTSQAMQQLQIQQQQLVSQLQLVQQRLLMLPSFGNNPGRKLSDSDYDNTKASSWKENNGNVCTSPSPKHIGGNHKLGAKFGEKEESRINLDRESSPSSPINQHPLFQHGVCQWPGCDSHFSDLVSFLKHVGHEHILDDKTTAQARVQMQIVAQLEHSLSKERERLQAMMAHLHLTKEAQANKSEHNRKPMMMIERNERSQSEGPQQQAHPVSPPAVSAVDMRPKSPPLKMRPPPIPPMSGPPPPGSLAAMQQAVSAAAAAGFGHLPNLGGHGNIGLPPTPLSALTAAARGSAAAAAAAAAAAGLTHPPTSMANHIRRRMAEKTPPIPMSNGLPYMFDRAGLDIAQEIHRNREFYRTNDVRPPFTYASLIRQAIVESPTGQLKLGEIYTWFSNSFKHFRTTCNLTWKNAIRTNLSLHKCFVRYEDDFGSFWMVDDAEFMKRRHLSRGRPRKYEPNSAQQQAAAQQKSADAVTSSTGGVPTSLAAAAAAQFKMAAGGSQAKSPSFVPNPSMYSDALNASLQSALGFAENNLPFLAHSGSASMVNPFHQHQREREEKQGLERLMSDFRPSSVEFAASKLLGGSNASSYLSPSSMSDTENNNNSSSEKAEDRQPASPSAAGLRLGRKRAASADLDGDLVHDDEDLEDEEDSLHNQLRRRPPSAEALAEARNNYNEYLVEQHEKQVKSDQEALCLKDISMLRNSEDHMSSRGGSSSIKREKY